MPRRAAGAGALVAAAVMLAGCSASVDPTAQSGDPFAEFVASGMSQSGAEDATSSSAAATGNGTVVVGVIEGEELPGAIVTGFEEATGFSVEEVSLSATDPQVSEVDVVIGLDAAGATEAASAQVLDAEATAAITAPASDAPAIEGALAYGRADICVVADAQWFAANRLSVPTGFEDLASSANAGLLVVPDPESSRLGEAFVVASATALGEDASSWWAGLAVAEGEDAESQFSGLSEEGTYPLTVLTGLDAVRGVTNTATESTIEVIGSTCLQRYLYGGISAGADNPAGAESLLTYLLEDPAQEELAQAAAAYPLAEGAAEGTLVGTFATPASSAVVVDPGEVADQLPQWLEAWSAAVTG